MPELQASGRRPWRENDVRLVRMPIGQPTEVQMDVVGGSAAKSTASALLKELSMESSCPILVRQYDQGKWPVEEKRS